jgi:hypothetical protein
MVFLLRTPSHSLGRAAILGCPVNSLRSVVHQSPAATRNQQLNGESPFAASAAILQQNPPRQLNAIQVGFDEMQYAMKFGLFYG